MLDVLLPIADRVRSYIDAHHVDPRGIIYSHIDAFTHKPFEPEFITPRKVPRRAEINPWAYWTYEDSVMMAGLYLDGLVLEYRVTGNAERLTRAGEIWRMLYHTFACSQVFGLGSFMRPYGGWEGLSQWAEPLGTDQASPMFSGLFRYLPHAPVDEHWRIESVMLRTLEWYERQGFEYFYYKCMMHPWNTGLQHAASYYLPAIAWAAQHTGEARWRDHLTAGLARLERGPVELDGSFKVHNLYRSFVWGSDITVLQEAMGKAFDAAITPDMLRHTMALCEAQLARDYTEPGYIHRLHKTSAEPGFKPYVRDSYNRERGMGFAYFATVHGGRRRPRHEIDLLCGLAMLGVEGAMERAVELMRLRQRVPEDFTAFLSEDYEQLPEEVHLYARSTSNLFEWYRNYWMLRLAASSPANNSAK